MGYAGEVHDRVDVGKERHPVDRRRQVGVAHDLDTDRKIEWSEAPPRGCPYLVPAGCQRNDQGTADKSRGAGDENSHRVVPRAKAVRSHATIAPPRTSAPMLVINDGLASVATASTTSATLTTKTRHTTSNTVNPRSVAT